MAYRADIEIGVRGARSLEQLRSSINQTARAVDSLNDVVSARGSLVQSIQNYTNNLNRAARSLSLVGAGTVAETKAVREYVQALGEANAARARQNSLVAQELANQRRVTPGNAGFGQQGPALPPALVRAQQVQQNWNRFFQEAAEVAQELQSSAAARTTNLKTNWNRFFQEAQELALELAAQTQRAAAEIRRIEGSASASARQRLAEDAARRSRIQNAGFGVQGPALPSAGSSTARGGQGIGGRIGGAISGSIIGGAFPLLFGQGGGAAAGGAIGGLVGGLAGPGGSFAGSLLGTLLGDIASRGQAVKQLGEDIGFSAEQTKTLADAFKTANTDVEKFTGVIQNIRGAGLELEQQATAIQLVTALTDKYGGSFEKVGNAVTSALESGKVSQAVLNQLTSQGITVQDALAEKYDVSRDKILDMAKKGEISVQSLLDTLVDLGNEATTAAEKTQTPFEKALATTGNLFNSFWQNVQGIFADIGGSGVDAATAVLNVFNTLLQDVLFPLATLLARIAALFADVVATGVRAAAELITGFRGVASAIGDAVMNVINMIPGLRTVVGLARQLISGVTGRKSNDWNDMPWPEGIPKPGSPGMIGRITAPSQAVSSGGGGKRAEKAARESQIPALQSELTLKNRILQITGAIGEARLEGNKATEAALKMEQILEERSAKIESINREKIPQAEKELKIKIATAEADQQLVEASYERRKEAQELAIKQQEAIANVLSGLDMELVKLQAKTDAEKQALQFIELENQLKDKGVKLTAADTEAIKTKIAELAKATKEQKAATAQLQMEKELFDGISSAVASTFSGAIDAAVQGTENLGDALADLGADLLATIGNMLIMYGIAQALGALGGTDGIGIFSSLASAFGYKGAKDGAYWSGGFEAFAEGGVVTGPTMGLIGEGGEPEYVIPASKMRGAMSRYAAGSRGSSVIPSSGETGTTQGSSSGVATAIDVRYSVERINSVDYVTADQFQAGMQQAAAQGAIQGEQLAMRKLQQSASTRNRLGLK